MKAYKKALRNTVINEFYLGRFGGGKAAGGRETEKVEKKIVQNVISKLMDLSDLGNDLEDTNILSTSLNSPQTHNLLCASFPVLISFVSLLSKRKKLPTHLPHPSPQS